MGDVLVSNRNSHSISTQLNESQTETYTNTIKNSLYRWSTIVTGSIPFTIINIAYLKSVDEFTGDVDTHLTNKNISTEYKDISISDYGSNNFGYRLECSGGIMRFIGTIDGLESDIILDAGNFVEFSNSISGKVYASVNPASVGTFSYNEYICATVYCGFTVKKLISIEEYFDGVLNNSTPDISNTSGNDSSDSSSLVDQNLVISGSTYDKENNLLSLWLYPAVQGINPASLIIPISELINQNNNSEDDNEDTDNDENNIEDNELTDDDISDAYADELSN